MKIQPTTAGLVAIIVALAGALVFTSCPRPDPAEKIPVEIRKASDSLKATRPEAEHRRDSVLRVVAVDTARAVRAERLARAAKDSAEGFRKRADSTATQARLYGDSAFLWRSAYENRTEEADQLRTALSSSDSALQARTAAGANLRLLWLDSEARRRKAEEVVIPGFERAIAQLEQPCRILGPIRCPSRKAVLIGATLAMVAALSAK